MKRLGIAIFVLCTTVAVAQTHQHNQMQIIDGSKTPELIPDTVARRLFYYTISAPAQPTDAEFARQTGALRGVGLTATDIESLRPPLAAFRNEFDAENAAYNALVASKGLAPYDITTRLDAVVQKFRGQLPASISAVLEDKMRSEKSHMQMGTGTGISSTNSLVTMVANYAAYGTGLTSASAIGTVGAGLSITIQGNATCKQLNGQPAQCPACSHTGTDTTTFNGGNVWSSNYPTLGDGTSVASVATGTDGTLMALNNNGAPYVFSGQGWTPLVGPPAVNGTPGLLSLDVYSATSAVAVTRAIPGRCVAGVCRLGTPASVYQWNPTTGTWTGNNPPISSGTGPVKAQAWGNLDMYALDSTNTAWVYSNTSTGFVWTQVPGTVYDIGGGTAIGPTISSGNVYQIVATSGYPNPPVFALMPYTSGPTLVSLMNGGGYGIDSAGTIWQNPGNLGAAWTQFTMTTPITAKQIAGGGANFWVTDGTGQLVRYFPTVTAKAKQTVDNPANSVNITGTTVVYNGMPGDLFGLVGSADLNCACVGNLFASIRWTAQVEVAETEAYWGGSPPPACSGDVCIYKVVNNCISPPDLNLGAVRSYNYVGIASNLTWIAIAPCIRFSWPGPWACGPPLALKTGINTLPPPPYACSSNP